MRIGIDLDNTLVCYDAVFEGLVRERGIELQPVSGRTGAPATKKDIRDAVRAAAGNEVWTEFQGLAYGPRMRDAQMMPGAEDFLKWAKGRGIALFVVSHKTRRSAIGGHDLHAPAVEWLRSHGFLSKQAGEFRSGAGPDTGLGLGLELGRSAFLEETKEAKFGRIGNLKLTHFIDDLEEFLTDPAFPAGVEKLHYAPEAEGTPRSGLKSFQHWSGILEFFKQAAP